MEDEVTSGHTKTRMEDEHLDREYIKNTKNVTDSMELESDEKVSYIIDSSISDNALRPPAKQESVSLATIRSTECIFNETSNNEEKYEMDNEVPSGHTKSQSKELESDEKASFIMDSSISHNALRPPAKQESVSVATIRSKECESTELESDKKASFIMDSSMSDNALQLPAKQESVSLATIRSKECNLNETSNSEEICEMNNEAIRKMDGDDALPLHDNLIEKEDIESRYVVVEPQRRRIRPSEQGLCNYFRQCFQRLCCSKVAPLHGENAEDKEDAEEVYVKCSVGRRSVVKGARLRSAERGSRASRRMCLHHSASVPSAAAMCSSGANPMSALQGNPPDSQTSFFKSQTVDYMATSNSLAPMQGGRECSHYCLYPGLPMRRLRNPLQRKPA
uniref:uncharacterized protein LOC123460246 n=1 Tax=Jaculus jaculus TaxID=51337 RepID=UPI001E1B499D|nr:uncharacterized protein LOC123460246 [Jaculus jaculus]